MQRRSLLSASIALAAAPSFAASSTKPEQAPATSPPKVAILATGGTIASRGSNSLALTDYGVGSGHKPVGIEVLLNAVPEIKEIASITGEQVFMCKCGVVASELVREIYNRAKH